MKRVVSGLVVKRRSQNLTKETHTVHTCALHTEVGWGIQVFEIMFFTLYFSVLIS